MTRMNDTTTTSAADSRLAEFEAVGNRLWPFVRHFAMAGACTDAVDAVVELGRLLGKDADCEAEADWAEEIRDMTVDYVANWLESSPFVLNTVYSFRNGISTSVSLPFRQQGIHIIRTIMMAKKT